MSIKQNPILMINSLKHFLPYLVACSSTLISPELQQKLYKCGFNIYIEAPVSNETIEDLVKMLDERKEKVQN